MNQFDNIPVRILLPVLSGVLLLLFSPGLSAQQEDIDKEVVVVRAFEPSVADAAKINLLPSLTDTISVTPVFSYSILPIPVASDFEVETITPARMSAEAVSRLYGSHIKLGIGSYMTPFAELSINNLRHNKFSGGMYLKHHSSQGRLQLDNNEKAFSQFGDNEMLFYGKRMGRRNVLSAQAGLQSNNFHFYGYDITLDTIPEKDDIRQRFITGNAGLSLNSSHPDSSHLNYDLSLDYNYFQDRLDVAEHGLNFRAGFNKFLRSQILGLDLGVDYFDNTLDPDHSNMILALSPWFNKADDEWEIFAGFHGFYDQSGDGGKLYFYPKASLQFSIIRNYVIPYIGLDGGLQVNNQKKVAFENRFILPGLTVRNTDRSMDLYGGVKGNFTRNIPFNFRMSYGVYNDMYFFVNDSTGLIGNQFDVVYDDIELLHFTAEVGANISDRFSLMARANLYDYGMKTQEHPWHKPTVDLNFSARYNIGNKILLNADVFYIGQRFARAHGVENDEAVELPGITDINLGLEYRYNRLLSGFLRLNNLTGNRYYRWNNYPVQGFTLMAGFTYSL